MPDDLKELRDQDLAFRNQLRQVIPIWKARFSRLLKVEVNVTWRRDSEEITIDSNLDDLQ